METQTHAAESSPAEPECPLPSRHLFVRTEEELITEYLKKKVNGQPIPVEKIHDVIFYNYSPMQLAANYAPLGEKEWYFFTPRNRKYPKGTRPRRSVESCGFWKASGDDKEIHSSTGECIGKKQALVFYMGRPKSEEKTNWMMHEYRLNVPSINMMLDDWVLCMIFENSERSSNGNNADLSNRIMALSLVDEGRHRFGISRNQEH